MFSKKILKFWQLATLSFLLSFVILTAKTEALYSPTIAQRAAVTKDHILTSQNQHGTGTVLSIVQTFISQDEARREQGKISGFPGSALEAKNEVVKDAVMQAVSQPLDSLMMFFNTIPSTGAVISNCLRNDIWTLEDLKNKTAEEMVKAYLVGDIINGNILKADYRYLVRNIQFLKEYASFNPDTLINSPETGDRMTVNQYLFGATDSINYYIFSFPEKYGCPEGDFEMAFDQVIRSAKAFEGLAERTDKSWGSIWEEAQANAKHRATQWIAANQFSTLGGGGQGGQTQSVLKGGGWEKFQAQARTEWEVAKKLIGPVTPLFSWSLWRTTGAAIGVGLGASKEILENNCAYYYPEDGHFQLCTNQQLQQKKVCDTGKPEEKAPLPCDRLVSIQGVEDRTSYFERVKELQGREEAKNAELEAAKMAFSYNLTLNTVGESNIKDLQEAFSKVEAQARAGVEALGSGAGKGLISIAKDLEKMSAQICPNKQ